jgi:hypothetical protein
MPFITCLTHLCEQRICRADFRWAHQLDLRLLPLSLSLSCEKGLCERRCGPAMKRTREVMENEDDEEAEAVGEVPSGLYCMILSHPYPTLKKLFFILLTPDPLKTLSMHNQRRSKLRATRPAAPFCYPLRVAGRFFLETTAIAFSDELVHGTRGLASLCQHFDKLAAKYALTRYDPNAALCDKAGQKCTLSTFLKEHGAPPNYVADAARLDQCYATLVQVPRSG